MKKIIGVIGALLLVALTAAPAYAAKAYPSDMNPRGNSSIVTIGGTAYVRIPSGSDARTTKFADTLLDSEAVEVCVTSWSNNYSGDLYVYGERIDNDDPLAPHTIEFTYDNDAYATRCQNVPTLDASVGGLSGAILVGVSGSGARVDWVRTVEITKLY